MDRYLLDSQVFVEFFKRSDQAVLEFLQKVGSSNVYISVITIGIVRVAINQKSTQERSRFERYLRDGIQAFKDRILVVDQIVGEQWSLINPITILRSGGQEPMGESEKLIIATSMEQGLIYLGKRPVTNPEGQLEGLGFMTRDPWREPL